MGGIFLCSLERTPCRLLECVVLFAFRDGLTGSSLMSLLWPLFPGRFPSPQSHAILCRTYSSCILNISLHGPGHNKHLLLHSILESNEDTKPVLFWSWCVLVTSVKNLPSAFWLRDRRQPHTSSKAGGFSSRPHTSWPSCSHFPHEKVSRKS